MSFGRQRTLTTCPVGHAGTGNNLLNLCYSCGVLCSLFRFDEVVHLQLQLLDLCRILVAPEYISTDVLSYWMHCY